LEAIKSLFDLESRVRGATEQDSEGLMDGRTAMYIAQTESIFVMMWKERLDRIVSRLSLQMAACASYSCLTVSSPVVVEHEVKRQ